MTEAHVPARAVWALAATQMVGYGTIYYSFAILAPAMARDFGWQESWVFGALSIGLLASGILAPAAGRMADRHGAGRMLALGSAAAALSLVATSLAPNGVAYLFGLIAVEVSSAFAFYSMAFAAVVQLGGRGAQRSITHITLIAGFGSTVFWPLTDHLHQQMDWREVYQVFAAANLVICLPLHLWIARLGRRARSAAAASGSPVAAPVPGQPVHRGIHRLMMLGFLIEGFVLSAILVHMVPIVHALGLSASAVLVTTLFGPSQVLSRLTNMVFGGKLRQAHLAIIAAALLPGGLAVLLLTLAWPQGALAFAVLFGLGSGLTSIIGGTLPLELFGAAGYGSRTGLINSARLFSSATAPFAFSLLQAGLGIEAALWTVAGLGCMGIVSFAWMAKLAGPPGPPGPVTEG